MDSQTMPSSARTESYTSVQLLQRQAASLLLYQSVLSGEVGLAFLDLLEAIHHSNSPITYGQAVSAEMFHESDGINCLQAYGHWFQALAARNQSWQDYLISQILKAENPLTQQAQQAELASLPPALVAAARHDLQVLQCLYLCKSEQLSQWVQTALDLPVAPVFWDPLQKGGKTDESPLQKFNNWTDALEDLATYYRKFGTGLFGEYRALRWQSGQLAGIAQPDLVQLTELVGYESQKETLLKNTEFLLAGYSALHVLLYGGRGSGKSSLVKALLDRYSNRGLRLLEVAKSDLQDLPVIIEQLRGAPQKFILFVDDLSFEEDEDTYKALKVLLEGSLTARPQNVVVYATSNRRHMIREFFGDRPRPRDSEEVHAWDTVQEKLSFSDRFGLTLTFEPADQTTYLTIVRHLATQARITLSQEDLEYRALQWATRHNGRSGRTARQFVDFLRADLVISAQKPIVRASE